MTETSDQATPQERLLHIAKKWRLHDKAYIEEKRAELATRKSIEDAQRVEYAARKDLRKAIDEVQP